MKGCVSVTLLLLFPHLIFTEKDDSPSHRHFYVDPETENSGNEVVSLISDGPEFAKVIGSSVELRHGHRPSHLVYEEAPGDEEDAEWREEVPATGEEDGKWKENEEAPAKGEEDGEWRENEKDWYQEDEDWQRDEVNDEGEEESEGEEEEDQGDQEDQEDQGDNKLKEEDEKGDDDRQETSEEGSRHKGEDTIERGGFQRNKDTKDGGSEPGEEWQGKSGSSLSTPASSKRVDQNQVFASLTVATSTTLSLEFTSTVTLTAKAYQLCVVRIRGPLAWTPPSVSFDNRQFLEYSQSALQHTDTPIVMGEFRRSHPPRKVVLGNGMWYGRLKNGPLLPETYYHVFIRLVTSRDESGDKYRSLPYMTSPATGKTAVFRTAPSPAFSFLPDSWMVWALAGVTLLFLLVILYTLCRQLCTCPLRSKERIHKKAKPDTFLDRAASLFSSPTEILTTLRSGDPRKVVSFTSSGDLETVRVSSAEDTSSVTTVTTPFEGGGSGTMLTATGDGTLTDSEESDGYGESETSAHEESSLGDESSISLPSAVIQAKDYRSERADWKAPRFAGAPRGSVAEKYGFVEELRALLSGKKAAETETVQESVRVDKRPSVLAPKVQSRMVQCETIESVDKLVQSEPPLTESIKVQSNPPLTESIKVQSERIVAGVLQSDRVQSELALSKKGQSEEVLSCSPSQPNSFTHNQLSGSSKHSSGELRQNFSYINSTQSYYDSSQISRPLSENLTGTPGSDHQATPKRIQRSASSSAASSRIAKQEVLPYDAEDSRPPLTVKSAPGTPGLRPSPRNRMGMLTPPAFLTQGDIFRERTVRPPIPRLTAALGLSPSKDLSPVMTSLLRSVNTIPSTPWHSPEQSIIGLANQVTQTDLPHEYPVTAFDDSLFSPLRLCGSDSELKVNEVGGKKGSERAVAAEEEALVKAVRELVGSCSMSRASNAENPESPTSPGTARESDGDAMSGGSPARQEKSVGVHLGVRDVLGVNGLSPRVSAEGPTDPKNQPTQRTGDRHEGPTDPKNQPTQTTGDRHDCTVHSCCYLSDNLPEIRAIIDSTRTAAAAGRTHDGGEELTDVATQISARFFQLPETSEGDVMEVATQMSTGFTDTGVQYSGSLDRMWMDDANRERNPYLDMAALRRHLEHEALSGGAKVTRTEKARGKSFARIRNALSGVFRDVKQEDLKERKVTFAEEPCLECQELALRVTVSSSSTSSDELKERVEDAIQRVSSSEGDGRLPPFIVRTLSSEQDEPAPEQPAHQGKRSRRKSADDVKRVPSVIVCPHCAIAVRPQ